MTIDILANVISTTPVAPPGADRFQWLVSIFTWFCYIAAVLGIVYGGARFAWEKWVRGGDLQAPKIIMGALIGGVVMAIAPSLIAGAMGQ
ncbi:hypothetical protein L1O03_02865 [Corynebacterium uropygiale]|uniref:Uncharacterized protein n=1 Tax=Corynebacterium uropygiale TaxID=1775911 RepID=A0A9X1QRA7_9CORY|nr:hypothetical protein [Corynebacterium uropygiale]MCF4006119.1 hypothetical protein [Corynebacterium uropygiale]